MWGPVAIAWWTGVAHIAPGIPPAPPHPIAFDTIWAEAGYRCGELGAGDFPGPVDVTAKALSATVDVDVDRQGEVAFVGLIHSSGQPAFDDAVRRTAAGWRYRPKYAHGTKWSDQVRLRFERGANDSPAVVTQVSTFDGGEYRLRLVACTSG